MVYLFESELPENKSVSFAMTRVFGIGQSNSNLICKKLGFSKNLKIKYLTKEQILKLVQSLESSNIMVLGDLKKHIARVLAQRTRLSLLLAFVL